MRKDSNCDDENNTCVLKYYSTTMFVGLKTTHYHEIKLLICM